MARGWESKSVEAQQEEASGDNNNNNNLPKQLSPEQLAARRRHEELVMIRKKIEHDMAAATNPRHRQMLQQALADLEGQITKLEV